MRICCSDWTTRQAPYVSPFLSPSYSTLYPISILAALASSHWRTLRFTLSLSLSLSSLAAFFLLHHLLSATRLFPCFFWIHLSYQFSFALYQTQLMYAIVHDLQAGGRGSASRPIISESVHARASISPRSRRCFSFAMLRLGMLRAQRSCSGDGDCVGSARDQPAAAAAHDQSAARSRSLRRCACICVSLQSDGCKLTATLQQQWITP